MKTKLIFFVILLLFVSCKNVSRQDASNPKDNNIVIANQFVDAFYSFDRDSLASILSNAIETQPQILYYQKWAECGNYEIINKHEPIEKNDTLVLCPVTVKDDLISALEIDFNVTDTFHLTINKGHIQSVQTSSNDPDTYNRAKEWVKKNHPEIFEGPCKGILEGGLTPCDCVKAMVKGFTEFKSSL